MKILRNTFLISLLILCTRIYASDSHCSSRNLYLRTNGFHSEIIIESKDLDLPESNHSNYISIGFGDLEFWRSGDFFAKPLLEQAKIASNSLFHPSLGVMSVIGSSTRGAQRIAVSKEDYEKVIKYISDSFKKDENGQLIELDYLQGYQLYQSTQKYYVNFTCNSWLSTLLNKSEIFELDNNRQAKSLFSQIEKRKFDNELECATHY